MWGLGRFMKKRIVFRKRHNNSEFMGIFRNFGTGIDSNQCIGELIWNFINLRDRKRSKNDDKTNHVSQTVEVWGGAQANAYAKCTAYSYTGNKPVLTVVSDSSAYPTNSTSFTGKTTDGQSMRYTVSIPPTNQKVTFRGSVSNYTSFIISAQVKG